MNIPNILIGALFASIPFALWFIHYQLNGIRNSHRNQVTYEEHHHFVIDKETLTHWLIDLHRGYIVFGNPSYPRILSIIDFTTIDDSPIFSGYEIQYHDIEQQRKAARDIIEAWNPYAAENRAFGEAFPNINPNNYIHE